MATFKLKKLLRRNPVITTVIQQFSECSGENLCVADAQGNVLLGQQFENNHTHTDFLIHFGDDVIGQISGPSSMKFLVEFIQSQVNVELDRRKLGAEVLDLYREVNLMYNFTQKLAETIDQKSIAELTLAESNNLINSNSGLVFLFTNAEISPLAHFGKTDINAYIQAEKEFSSRLLGKEEGDIFNNYELQDERQISFIYVPLNSKSNLLGGILLSNDNGHQFTAADLKLLSTLSVQSAAAIETAQLYERNIREVEKREAAIRTLHEVASRFVPNEFIKSLGFDKITEVNLGDSVEKEVTVLFSDIRGYTSLSENMTPEDTFKLVNAFNNRMGPIILKNRGFVNQYLGDGIMAIFPFNPSDALNAAVDMQRELQIYNQERLEKKRPIIKIGIGLHTGDLIMGITGDDNRLDATTISDTVNTAARIESLTKQYSVNIMLTESSLSKIKMEFNGTFDKTFKVRYLGEAYVKGKKQPLKIYECFDGDLPDAIQFKSKYLSLYNEAIAHFEEKEYLEAAARLNQIVFSNPKDKIALLFLNKVNQFIAQKAEAHWNHLESTSPAKI